LQADDDDGPVLPVDPGLGFEGILPDPPLTPYLVPDQGTSPWGIRQVFNTPATVMGQSFRPGVAEVDWVAFVVQNNTQPGTEPGDGVLRAQIFTTLDPSSGELGGLLGTSGLGVVASDSTAWVFFAFPETVSVTVDETYYCRLEMVEGYPSWAGGRLQNFYHRGAAFGFLPDPFGRPPQDLNWDAYDLVFAVGRRARLADLLHPEFAAWCSGHGLGAADPLGDPDADGELTFGEYLRDGDPTGGGGRGIVDPQLVNIGDAVFLSVTFAAPARLAYAAGPGGSLVASVDGVASDRFEVSLDLEGGSADGLGFVEVVPPLSAGLPPLSSSHGYRTFRLSEPVSGLPRAFVTNRVVVEDED
jgi:hypothetical protein